MGHDPLASAATLLACAAVSLVTSLAVHLYFHAATSHYDTTAACARRSSSDTRDDDKRVDAAAPSRTQVDRSAALRTSVVATASNASEAPAATDALPTCRANPIIDLQSLPADQVPDVLRLDAFISREHQTAFEHAGVFAGCTNVFAVLNAIHPYLTSYFETAEWASATASRASFTILRLPALHGTNTDDMQWRLTNRVVDRDDTTEIVLYKGVDSQTFAPDKVINVSPRTAADTTEPPTKQRIVVQAGAVVLGGTFDVSRGSVVLGRNVRVEPNVVIHGPAIIGDGATLRSGAYIRGDVLVGRNVVLRGELKNVVVLDDAELCHPSYCGDSICGVASHFGNQVTTANLNLFSRTHLTIDVDNKRYDTGRTKIGVILGDYSQLGCSSVTDPCTLLRQHTVAYPLARLPKGVYGPYVVIKNKPLEHGVLEIAPLRQQSVNTQL